MEAKRIRLRPEEIAFLLEAVESHSNYAMDSTYIDDMRMLVYVTDKLEGALNA